jgi:hypothetical protein
MNELVRSATLLVSKLWVLKLAREEAEDRRQRVFQLRFSAPGKTIYQRRVRIDKHAARELQVQISIAT